MRKGLRREARRRCRRQPRPPPQLPQSAPATGGDHRSETRDRRHAEGRENIGAPCLFSRTRRVGPERHHAAAGENPEKRRTLVDTAARTPSCGATDQRFGARSSNSAATPRLTERADQGRRFARQASTVGFQNDAFQWRLQVREFRRLSSRRTERDKAEILQIKQRIEANILSPLGG